MLSQIPLKLVNFKTFFNTINNDEIFKNTLLYINL